MFKRHERRLGDGGKTAFLELLKEGETKPKKERPAAPALRVETPPTPETPPAPAPEPTAQTPPAAPERQPIRRSA